MPNLPKQLLNSLSRLEHFNEAAFIESHREEHKITSVRVNPFKKAGFNFNSSDPIPWSTGGFYLSERPSFTHDPLFHAGCYYVQEPGSMFIEYALKQTLDFNEPLKILDACAAPGGKSTVINSLLNDKSLLVSNEIIKSRADVLAHNLSKWGTCNAVVTNNETNRYTGLTSFFDAVVVDAPCSGSGLFRKQPEAIEEWSDASVKACSIRQQSILTDILPSVKAGGIVIYSTCSYSVEENEDIVKWLISEHGLVYVPLELPNSWGIVKTVYGLRFYPHMTRSEGFFCAVLRKANDSETTRIPKPGSIAEANKNEKSMWSAFLAETSNIIVKKNERFYLLNHAAAGFLQNFEKNFYYKKAGTLLGEIKGKDVVPDHELALSIHLQTDIKSSELDEENAIRFLKKETFSICENAVGLHLIRHKEFGLGWAKILANRVNNYLPGGLRILK